MRHRRLEGYCIVRVQKVNIFMLLNIILTSEMTNLIPHSDVFVYTPDQHISRYAVFVVLQKTSL